MGSTTFEHYAAGVDPKDAFSRAREEAGYDSGHGGYSGTIVEKGDFTIITRTPLLDMEAAALARRLVNDGDPRINDKWGPAGAIPIIKVPADAKATRIAPIAFDIPGGLDWGPKEKEVEKAVRSMKLKAGEQIVDWRITKDTPGRAKVTAVAPKGATMTKYIVKGSVKHGTWETGFLSQAEARTWATETMKNDEFHWRDDTTTWEIEGVSRRIDGEPLVRLVREVGKHLIEVDVEVRLAGFSTEGKNPTGWLFFGWASC